MITPSVPLPSPLHSSPKLLFLKWYKSDNWVALRWGVDGEGDLPSGWILLNGSVPPRLPIPDLSFSLYHCSPSYPCGVTRITSFSPNGHFAWQVHYTFYFQIVLTLLMPGRLIAWAWLAEKGLRHALGPWTERHWLLFSSEPDWGPWKERFYPSVLYPCLTKGPMHWDGLCHQRDSVNSSEQSLSFPPLFLHSWSSPSLSFPPFT